VPRPQNLAVAPIRFPALPEESPEEFAEEFAEDRLTGSVSAASLSFVACGAAISALGDLLGDLRLALETDSPEVTDPEGRQAATLLAARLEFVASSLDDATAAARGLLEDAFDTRGGRR